MKPGLLVAILIPIFFSGMMFGSMVGKHRQKTKENNMAKATAITVNYGETINLGNYESLRLDYGITVTLDGDEDEKSAELLHAMRKQLKKELKAAVVEEIGSRNKTVNKYKRR